MEELDQPGEWYYDRETRSLFLWPNATTNNDDVALRNGDHDASSRGGHTRARGHDLNHSRQTGNVALPPKGIVVPLLRTLVRIDGGATGTVTDVSFEGVGFRDSAATYMAKEWSAPSGGDWSL